MEITITIGTESAADKLKEIRQPQVKQQMTVRNKLDSRTAETLDLLKKRLDRQSEPVGGSI